MSVRRMYVEKKKGYDVIAQKMLAEFTEYLGVKELKDVRVLSRYDVENISEETYQIALKTVFADVVTDTICEEELNYNEKEDRVFSMESVPGQFDQRADSTLKAIALLEDNDKILVRSATTYVLNGNISDEDFEKIKGYVINKVASRETPFEKPATLARDYGTPEEVAFIEGFISKSEDEIAQLFDELNLAMTVKDLLHIQNYFRETEKRNPSVTEIRVLDTYWSDHCRHTTFLTELSKVEFEDGYYTEEFQNTYRAYLSDREVLYKGKDKDICLMDIAVLAMKKLRAEGKLDDMEESEEINACSIVVPVEIDGKEEEWLVFFKNETHNHPTEIEPFGGAATCLGGGIRDPLSGRGYVYQAMRITAAADPRKAYDETLEGKLPQRTLCRVAAEGYSSYGNQIGIAAGYLDEIYHPNYVAKRMELGALVAASPRANVRREKSMPGDKIILLGGRTGRDGIGGATGSSRVQTTDSIDTLGAEVQKGDAPLEKKVQRIFRRPEVSRLIKKCNDFGAGGVSVAIGELADGLRIDLDKVPAKYPGLNGTELAISESQERMAIVVDDEDVAEFLKYAEEENLESTVVAEVTEDPRLVILWKGQEIVNIARSFLDTNGAHQEAEAIVTIPEQKDNYFDVKDIKDIKSKWLETLADLNVCSQKGLSEMFDGSVGAGTVTMAYGGKNQLTPIQTMIAKLPVLKGKCDAVTMMAYGYDPFLASWSPYHGSAYAVLSSVAKIVASGGDYKKIRLSFQEFFKRLGKDAKRWGEPLVTLLGAYNIQTNLEIASIGGKDSMSGTYNDIDVPPTLASFAVAVANMNEIVTPELKEAGNELVVLNAARDQFDMPAYSQIKKLYDNINALIKAGRVKSSYAIGMGGIIEAVSKMAFGNGFGVEIANEMDEKKLIAPEYGSIILELSKEDVEQLSQYGFEATDYQVVGKITNDKVFKYNNMIISMEEAVGAWTNTLEEVFPTKAVTNMNQDVKIDLYHEKNIYIAKQKLAKPTVFIPVFPSTNSEYDQIKAFEEAGANIRTLVFNNSSAQKIEESYEAFANAIKESQILLMTSGFSSSDEPFGTGRYVATAFRNSKLVEATNDLLNNRDGLVLGIGQGFQVLMKLGLLPYGEIKDITSDGPAITTNLIGRHVSRVTYTKVVSNKSPWFSKAKLGEVYSLPISNAEGRFVASNEWTQKLIANGQIAAQYVDLAGNPTMDVEFNPSGSDYAIEAITSADGRVLGKMAHSDRVGEGVAINIYGNQDQIIFKSGVEYFK